MSRCLLEILEGVWTGGLRGIIDKFADDTKRGGIVDSEDGYQELQYSGILVSSVSGLRNS